MHQSNNQIAGHVNARNDEHQSPLWGIEELSKAFDLIQLEVHANHVENNQSHQQKSIETEYVRYVVGMFRPLCSKQTPGHTEYDHEDVYKCQDLCSVLNYVVGTRLNYRCVKDKHVKRRNEVAVNE